jgi:hypothetical protein
MPSGRKIIPGIVITGIKEGKDMERVMINTK